MPRLQRRPFADAEDIRRFSHGILRTVTLDDTVVGESVLEPGWRWSRDVRPIAGTAECQYRHLGVVLRGQLHVVMNDGTTLDLFAGDAFEIPPGHDAWVVGDEAWHSIEFIGVRTFALPPAALGGGGVIATLLFTDIVGSTATLERLGDLAWRALLSITMPPCATHSIGIVGGSSRPPVTASSPRSTAPPAPSDVGRRWWPPRVPWASRSASAVTRGKWSWYTATRTVSPFTQQHV